MVVGLDLSINSTGVCIYDKGNVEYFLIVPKVTKRMREVSEKEGSRIHYKTYDKIASLDSHNIRCIAKEICKIIADKVTKIETVVIEDVALAARGRSIITLTLLNGYLRCMMDQMGLWYELVNPTQWKKKILGNGQANKDMIVDVWSKMDPESYNVMMGGKVKFKCDDIADAYFLCRYGDDLWERIGDDEESDNNKETVNYVWSITLKG